MDGNGNGRRAVLYARCSGDDRGNDGRNLAGQLEMARAYATSKGYQVVAEVSEDDKGASGAAFELEGLTRIREMAAAGAFDVLVPREIDRLSRNLAKQLIVEEELLRAGVGIEYVLGEYPDTPEGRLQKHIKATIAEYEREKIAERVTRGKRNKIKAGEVVHVGRVAYGYRAAEVDGKSTLVPYEPEARVVLLIFSWYVDGDESGRPVPIRAIARKLAGVPSYADVNGITKERATGHWSAAAVAYILKNETYAGRWHFGRRNNYAKTDNPAENVLTVEVPAIVDRDTWDRAQDQLTVNREQSRRNRKGAYLLAGRLKCGTCNKAKMAGATYHTLKGKGAPYYRCPARDTGGDYAHKCDSPYFRADHVDAAVWGWVCEFITNPAALERGLRESQQERNRENEPIRRRLAVVDDLLTDNRRQLGRLLDLYLASDFDTESEEFSELLTDRKARLEVTIRALEGERADLVTRLEAQTLTEEQIKGVLDLAAELAPGLEEMREDFDARRGLIEKLNVQAMPYVEDGIRMVEASCIVDRRKLRVVSNTSSSCRHNAQSTPALTGRPLQVASNSTYSSCPSGR